MQSTETTPATTLAAASTPPEKYGTMTKQRSISCLEKGTEEVLDAMTYQTSHLITWQALCISTNTVWLSPILWFTLLKLVAVSLTVATIAFFAVSDPATLKVAKFTKIATYLNVFVGLLLGFFLTSSMNRWYNCANGFLELFDAVRNLQMQFFALGADEFKSNMVIRYGVLSACLLNMELSATALPTPEEQAAAVIKHWNELAAPEGAHPETDPVSGKYKIMYDEEREILKKSHDPAGLMWLWVGSLVGRMAQDGDIPPMASPTYGRIMGLAQSGYEGMRQVRASITVQAPFIYVHMLATLVHINNLINAVSFGMTCGAAFSVLLAHERMHPSGAEATESQMVSDMQNVVVSFFYSIFGPFLYQALLEVAICIAQPFSSEAGKIPTKKLLHNLERDLQDGIKMAHNLPWWDQAHFRKPVVVASP